jgi:hypothetical protein
MSESSIYRHVHEDMSCPGVEGSALVERLTLACP